MAEGTALVSTELKDDGHLDRQDGRDQETHVRVGKQSQVGSRILGGQERKDR